VATIVIGGVLDLNISRPVFEKFIVTDAKGKISGEVLPYRRLQCGWPEIFYIESASYVWFDQVHRTPQLVPYSGWMSGALFFDIAIGVGLVLLPVIIWEGWMRQLPR
jgi:hypothetical protein